MDREYIDKSIPLSLFEELNIKLAAPNRRNQKEYVKYDPKLKIKRKPIDAIFSQFDDDYNLQKKFMPYRNYIHGIEINQNKHD